MCRPPVCRLPMCPRPPICRGPLAVRVSGPAGSLPCREECSAVQEFGIPNSNDATLPHGNQPVNSSEFRIPLSASRRHVLRNRFGVCRERMTRSRIASLRRDLGMGPSASAAAEEIGPIKEFCRLILQHSQGEGVPRCGALRRGRVPGSGGAVRGRAKQSDLGSCIVPAAFRPGLARGTRRAAAALRTVAARRIPYRKVRRLKVLTRLRLSSSLHAGRITDIRSRTDADRAPVEEHR